MTPLISDPATARDVARVKRFVERFTGDRAFRDELNTSDGAGCRAIARAAGIDLDPAAIGPMWRNGLRLDLSEDEAALHPLLAAWAAHKARFNVLRERGRMVGGSGLADPRLAAWRARCIKRNDLRFGLPQNEGIMYSTAVFELTQGCSMGCRFCGVAAEKLSAVYPYTEETRRLWREVLETVVDRLGLSAIQTAFCYWATEPFDNPHYLDFILQLREMSGHLPPTTTAACLRDLTVTRRMMEMRARHGGVPDRFSILSTPILRQVHKIFSADELLNVDLAIQTRDSFSPKAAAGRNRGARDAVYSSIACAAGFVVNMAARSVMLISPCPASDRWPKGYQIHMSGEFHDAADLGAFMTAAIDTHMVASPDGAARLALANGIAAEIDGDTVRVRTSGATTEFETGRLMAQVVRLASQGDATVGSAIAALIAEGADYPSVIAALQVVFDSGLLAEPTDPLPA